MTTTITSSDGQKRCHWCNAVPALINYHDTEWGFPVSDDQRLFEKLCLEAFQSGLNWRTILAKRENFRAAFHDFNFDKIASFTQRDINRLLKNKGIVRHRGKIEAVVNNAQCAQALIGREGSLATFIWRYEPDAKRPLEPQNTSTSPESASLSKDLKKMGWKFLGPTTVYAFMQAIGLINDHDSDCIIQSKVERTRKRFKRPQGC